MTKYTITFTSYPDNSIDIIYNSSNTLIKFDATHAQDLTDKQIMWMYSQVPTLLTNVELQLKEFIKKANDKIVIVQADIDTHFDTFWQAYDYKRNRKQAEAVFTKLSHADKVKAIYSSKAYHAYRRRKGDWLEQMLPDTYLRNRQFDTDWGKLRV